MKFSQMPYSRPDMTEVKNTMQKLIQRLAEAQSYEEAKAVFLEKEEQERKDALVAYENPNMPKEEIINKAHTYCSRTHRTP